MGNESSSHKAESQRARKRRIDDKIEVSKELRENTSDLILVVKNNFFYINKICPCFELDYFFFKNKTFKEIKNDTHDYSSEKTNYIKELVDKINQYQIEADGESVLKYNISYCPHFYCMKCKESNKNKPCIYCDNYITDKNLACFVNMDDIEVKNAFRHIIYKYHEKNVSEKQYSRFKVKLISGAANFLLTNDNIYSKIKNKVNIKESKKENKEKKEPVKKNQEKKLTLKQQHKDFYSILKINKDYINYICPYCLKNKEGQDVSDLVKESILSSPSENEMKEHLNLIAVQINTDRILDLRSVLNFRFKCQHFYHKECKEKVKDKTCFYCKYYINPLNLACFTNQNWKIKDEGYIWEITAKFRGKRYRRRSEYPVLYRDMYYEVRQFLYTYPVIFEEYRQKFISLYRITEELTWCYYLYKYDYDIDIKINISEEKRKDLEEELEKAKIKQKKMEDDEWEKRMKEIDEKYKRENDDDEDDDNSYDNNYTHRSNEGNKRGNEDYRGYKLKACSSEECCNKKCFLCNKKAERLQPKNLYAHNSCHIKGNCFVCKKKNKASSDIKICPKCKDKLRGTNYDFKCYICKGKINQFNN